MVREVVIALNGNSTDAVNLGFCTLAAVSFGDVTGAGANLLNVYGWNGASWLPIYSTDGTTLMTVKPGANRIVAVDTTKYEAFTQYKFALASAATATQAITFWVHGKAVLATGRLSA